MFTKRQLGFALALFSALSLASFPVRADDGLIHVLLVVDTAADQNGTLGLGIAGDRMGDLLKSLPEAEEARLRVTRLSGSNASPDSIHRYYRELNSNPMDVLFFYYMGHGGVFGNRDNGQYKNGQRLPIDHGRFFSEGPISYSGSPESSDPTYHALTLRHGRINRMEIRALMSSRPCRCCIMFTDCCASFSEGREGKQDGPEYSPLTATRFASRMRDSAVNSNELASAGTINAELWKRLFREHMGLIDVAGAPVGYYGLAQSRIGGFSSFALTELLCASNDLLIRMTNEKTNWPVENGLPDWSVFTSHVLTPQYCQHFPQVRSERSPRNEERIFDFGPRLLEPTTYVVFTPRIQQLSKSTIVFGSTGDGICCRIQPEGHVPAGFYWVDSCDDTAPHLYASQEVFERILNRRARKIQIARSRLMSSGRMDCETYDLIVGPRN